MGVPDIFRSIMCLLITVAVLYDSNVKYIISESESNCGVAAADAILLQTVLSRVSYFVVPMALMFRLAQSIHICFGLPLILLPSGTISSLSSDVVLVWSFHVSKPPQSRFPASLCDILYTQSLPDVIISHLVS